MKIQLKTVEPPLVDTKSVTQISASTQTLLMEEEFQYPCKICIYNADNPLDLSVHMDYAHDDDEDGTQIPKITCNICKKTYQSKNILMQHIKTSHETSMPACKYFQNDTCKFNEKSCWFVHRKVDISAYKCRYCDYKCAYKSDIMKHQKASHQDKLQICKSHVQYKCKFKDKCWFNHVDIAKSNLSNMEGRSKHAIYDQQCSEMEERYEI